MHGEPPWLPRQALSRQLRLPPMAASILAAGMAVACTSATPPPASPGRDFAQYRALPHYRAFAVTGGTLDGGGNYASGWSLEKASVEAAVDEALSECNRFRDAASQPACQLYAIGDLVVAGTDAAQLPRAKCVYLLSAATPPADPDAASCAKRLFASLAPAVAAASEPTPTSPPAAMAPPPAGASPAAAGPEPASLPQSRLVAVPSLPRSLAVDATGPEAAVDPVRTYRALADIRVRQGPGNRYPSIGALVRDDAVSVVGERNGWLQVRLRDGRSGFVFRRWLVAAAE
jgi:hypothetical protein